MIINYRHKHLFLQHSFSFSVFNFFYIKKMDEATDFIDNRNHTVLQYEREKRKKIEISTTTQNNQQNV